MTIFLHGSRKGAPLVFKCKLRRKKITVEVRAVTIQRPFT